MDDCIFCSIAKGSVPAVKIWEDENFLALLDLFPNTRGQALVIPRKHIQSYLFDLGPEEINGIMLAARKVSGMLEEGLGVKRVNLVFEGLEIDHLHAKLYPVHGLKERFESIHSRDTVSFGNYPGFVTTLHGPRAGIKDLEAVARAIREKQVPTNL